MVNKMVSALVLLTLVGLIWLNRSSPQGGASPGSSASPGGQPSQAVSQAVCNGRIWYVVRSGAEVRFGYEGQAEQIRLEWPGGVYEARVEDSCSGTDCKLFMPRPGLSEVRIRLDGCPWEKVP